MLHRAALIVMLVLASCALARSACASLLATSALVGKANQIVDCIVVNVGTKTITVTGQLFSTSTGGMLINSGPFTVDPGQAPVAAGTGITASGAFYCKFDGPKSSMRASILIYDDSSTSSTTLSADAR